MKTRDLHVESIRPLLPPAILLEELPLSEKGSLVVGRTRKEVTRVLRGEDDRLLVIVGPCSIHDPVAGLDYARRLKKLADELGHDLRIVMRVYFEKPRTTVGWKGLINDPHLDGSFAINEGLRLARRLLLDLVELGLPSGCEFLDPITRSSSRTSSSGARSARARRRARSTASSPPACRCPWASRTARTVVSRSQSTPYARRSIRTASWASRSRVWRASFRPAATLTATSSCAAASTGRTTTRSACRRRSPRSATPGFPHGS